MGHVIHRNSHGISEPFLEGLGRARPGNDVLARMNHQRRRLYVTEVLPNVVPTTGLHKAQMGLDTSLQRTPHTAAAKQLFAVGIVVVGFKRQGGHHRLKSVEPRVFVDVTKCLKVVREHGVSPGPAAHIHHTSHQVGPLHRNPLPDARTNADQSHEIHRLHIEVIQQPNNVVGKQLR